MTVIAYDGKWIAADRQSNSGNLVYPSTKLRRLDNGEVIASTGYVDTCTAIENWYAGGADLDRYPQGQADKERYAVLVVVSTEGVWEYVAAPARIPIEGPFHAWGSGCEVAFGLLAAGRSAVEAVETAIHYCHACGLGIDAIELATGKCERYSIESRLVKRIAW